MKKILLIIIVIFVILNFFQNLLTKPISRSRMTIGQTKINLLLAKTPQQIEKGLGGLNKLDQNQGMLFLMGEKRVYSFWMKGMKFPLDIIWINEDLIEDITKDIPVGEQNNLKVYTPTKPVNYILEVNAGFSDMHGIKIGDRVEY